MFSDGKWVAVTEDLPDCRGEGVTQQQAIDDLKRQVDMALGRDTAAGSGGGSKS